MTNHNDFDMIKCSDLWVTKFSEDTNMILLYEYSGISDNCDGDEEC